MVSRLQLALIVAASSIIATPSYADVQVFGGTGCFEPNEVTNQLQSILQTHSTSSQLQVRLGAHIGKTYVAISMRILSSKGRVLMQREYELLPSDCSSVPELLGIVVEEFLREIPVTQWALPPEEKSPQQGEWVAPGSPYKEYTATFAIGTEAMTPNLVGEISFGAKFWESLPVQLGVSWAGASPQVLADGKVFYSSLVGMVGYDYQRPTWKASVKLKAGALGVWGRDLPNGRRHVLGWFEAEAGIGLVWNELIFIPKVSYSPMAYQFETLDKEARVEMPVLKFLVGVEIPFGQPHG